MSTIKVDGRMTVATLKKRFKETFGLSLRVYVGNNKSQGARFADEKTLLGTLSDEKGAIKRGSEFTVTDTMTVGEFEEAFQQAFDIAVQVADAVDSKLLPNDATLLPSKDLSPQSVY